MSQQATSENMTSELTFLTLPPISLLPTLESQIVGRISGAERSVMRRMRGSSITAQYATLLRPTN